MDQISHWASFFLVKNLTQNGFRWTRTSGMLIDCDIGSPNLMSDMKVLACPRMGGLMTSCAHNGSMKHSFHATERNVSGAPILLIYDGHGSHTTAGMRTLA